MSPTATMIRFRMRGRRARPHLARGLAASCALVLLAPAAPAQTYPARAVRVISPNPPGGANDTTARIIADVLKRATP